jgi:hypothetical protein
MDMEIAGETILGILGLSGTAMAVGGGWVISVEKRINGLKALQKTVDRVDRRTEKLSMFIAGRDVTHDDSEGL